MIKKGNYVFEDVNRLLSMTARYSHFDSKIIIYLDTKV